MRILISQLVWQQQDDDFYLDYLKAELIQLEIFGID